VTLIGARVRIDCEDSSHDRPQWIDKLMCFDVSSWSTRSHIWDKAEPDRGRSPRRALYGNRVLPGPNPKIPRRRASAHRTPRPRAVTAKGDPSRGKSGSSRGCYVDLTDTTMISEAVESVLAAKIAEGTKPSTVELYGP
jgi:hypothetical protein